MHETEELTVTLTLDNDEEVECVILAIFEVTDLDHEYIALTPLEEEDDSDELTILFYRFKEMEDGEPELSNIEDNEEYERVAETFDEWLDLEDLEDFEDFEDLEEAKLLQ